MTLKRPDESRKHGIHQISGEIVIDGVMKEDFNFYVQPAPDKEIENKALSIAGITREDLAKYPPMKDVYKSFVAMLDKYVDKFNKKDKFFLVGYNNASFDNPFLRKFFEDNGDKYFGSWFWSNSIDVMVLCVRIPCDTPSGYGEFQVVHGRKDTRCECG